LDIDIGPIIFASGYTSVERRARWLCKTIQTHNSPLGRNLNERI